VVIFKYLNKFDCEASIEVQLSPNWMSEAKTLDPGLRRDDDFEANRS
jgi:hypothetical protein